MACASTKNLGASVAPDYAVRKLFVCFTQRKAFAPQEGQLARDAAAVTAETTVGSDYPMTGDINRHRIVVQRIADGPRSFRCARRRAQGLIAHHRAARDLLKLIKNFFLKRTRCQSQIGRTAQRIGVPGEIATNFGADCLDLATIFHGIYGEPKLGDDAFERIAAEEIMDEHDAAPAESDEQSAKGRIYHADCDFGSAHGFERVIDAGARAA